MTKWSIWNKCIQNSRIMLIILLRILQLNTTTSVISKWGTLPLFLTLVVLLLVLLSNFIVCGKVKYELRVEIHELWVQIHELEDQKHELQD